MSWKIAVACRNRMRMSICNALKKLVENEKNQKGAVFDGGRLNIS